MKALIQQIEALYNQKKERQAESIEALAKCFEGIDEEISKKIRKKEWIKLKEK